MNAKIISEKNSNSVLLFLCGDVMTGRGIDQILPYPSNPVIYETYMKDAGGYVEIAESVNGHIKRPVDFPYIWGDSLAVLDQLKPNARIINLETSITSSNDCWKEKGINYRMNPQNIGCITAAGIDCVVLSNNHTLDWGYSGFNETIEVLKKAKLLTAGAGKNITEAREPAIIKTGNNIRILIFAYGAESSGIPVNWKAEENKAGVNLLTDFSPDTVKAVRENIKKYKKKEDIAVFSIHWGYNWGYEVPRRHIEFAHNLIDDADIDIVYGHSSHHPKGIEIYKNKPVIYGCGDFINDYEGISGYEEFRDDLSFMYFPEIDINSKKCLKFILVPMQIKKFQLSRASKNDAVWLLDMLNREGEKLGTGAKINEDNIITLNWKKLNL